MAFVMGYTGETGKALVKELNRQKVFTKVVLIGRRLVDLDKEIGSEFVRKNTYFCSLKVYFT